MKKSCSPTPCPPCPFEEQARLKKIRDRKLKEIEDLSSAHSDEETALEVKESKQKYILEDDTQSRKIIIKKTTDEDTDAPKKKKFKIERTDK